MWHWLALLWQALETAHALNHYLSVTGPSRLDDFVTLFRVRATVRASIVSCVNNLLELMFKTVASIARLALGAPVFTSSQQQVVGSTATSACLLAFNRNATKKAGGQCHRPNKARYPKHYGVKMYGGELVFPGQIIVRQRGCSIRPGFNVGEGRNHTIFADRVGFVKFHTEELLRRHHGGPRKFVSVVPIGDDWSESYAEKEQVMVERRAEIKRRMLRHFPKEPALYMPLPKRKQIPNRKVLASCDTTQVSVGYERKQPRGMLEA